VLSGQGGIGTQEPGFPSNQQLWDFLHGVLHEVLLQPEKVYGADTMYSKAVANWYNDALDSTEKPLPGQRGFRRRFNTAQLKVLSWANMDANQEMELSLSRLSNYLRLPAAERE
jgi:hypothetical protein